MTNSVFLFLC